MLLMSSLFPLSIFIPCSTCANLYTLLYEHLFYVSVTAIFFKDISYSFNQQILLNLFVAT